VSGLPPTLTDSRTNIESALLARAPLRAACRRPRAPHFSLGSWARPFAGDPRRRAAVVRTKRSWSCQTSRKSEFRTLVFGST